MTDRELLELAAKAAGYEIEDDENHGLVRFADDGAIWNPLTDDGDALRLAVKLGIHTMFGERTRSVCAHKHAASALEEYAVDSYTATRRAIVRAAAAIGKEMP
jgi:hypothetical protein